MADSPRDAALAHLARHWASDERVCPICHGHDIAAANEVLTTIDRIPTIYVVCMDCGYTFMFNAVVAGLLPSAASSSPDTTP